MSIDVEGVGADGVQAEGRIVRVRREMGQRFKVLRLALGMTQLQLSEALGVSCATISAWESGRNPLDLVILAEAAERFGFTTDYVARGHTAGLAPGLADRLFDGSISLPPRTRRGRPPTPWSQTAAE